MVRNVFSQFYFSEIQGQPVFDADEKRIGVIQDIVALMGPKFPPLTKIKVRSGRKRFFIPWTQVLTLDSQSLVLRPRSGELRSFPLHEKELLLGKHVLDHQLVDVKGRKMVRVNDVKLSTIEGVMCLVGVSIGSLAIVRRLGFGKLVKRLSFIRLREELLAWPSVVPLSYTDPNVKLNVEIEKLAKLHTADLAEILSDMSVAERSDLFNYLNDEIVADIIEEFTPQEQAQILESLEEERIPDVLEKMSPDDAADVLQELPPEDMAEIIDKMEKEEAEDVRELIQHERDSAGGLMTNEFLALPYTLTVAQVLEEVRMQAQDMPTENIYNIYLVDERNALKGVAHLRDLIMADPDTRIVKIMNDEPIFADVDDDAVDAARLIAKYDLLSLPLVAKGELAGIITVDDALDVLLPNEWKKLIFRDH